MMQGVSVKAMHWNTCIHMDNMRIWIAWLLLCASRMQSIPEGIPITLPTIYSRGEGTVVDMDLLENNRRPIPSTATG